MARKADGSDGDDFTLDVGTKCPQCGQDVDLNTVENLVRLAVRQAVKRFYEGWLVSDDSSAPDLRTRCAPLRGSAVAHQGRRVVVRRQFAPRELYNQLFYLASLVDVRRADAVVQGENATRARASKSGSFQPVRVTDVARWNAARAVVDRTLARCGYMWVDPTLFGRVFRLGAQFQGSNAGVSAPGQQQQQVPRAV